MSGPDPSARALAGHVNHLGQLSLMTVPDDPRTSRDWQADARAYHVARHYLRQHNRARCERAGR